jgi:hypothetical protein
MLATSDGTPVPHAAFFQMGDRGAQNFLCTGCGLWIRPLWIARVGKFSVEHIIGTGHSRVRAVQAVVPPIGAAKVCLRSTTYQQSHPQFGASFQQATSAYPQVRRMTDSLWSAVGSNVCSQPKVTQVAVRKRATPAPTRIAR